MRPFRDIIRQRILNLTVKSLNDLFPDRMANLFKRPSHRSATRAKTNLSLRPGLNVAFYTRRIELPSGAPNEKIVQNPCNTAFLNVF